MVEMGSYFISGVLRLNVILQSSDQPLRSSVILKVPQMGALEYYGRRMKFFAKERFIYEQVLPLMYESWSGEKVVPDFYASTESGILVLENLEESGFHSQHKASLLDLSACKVALKALAQFHALSIQHIDEVRWNLDMLTALDMHNGDWAKKVYPPVVEKIKKYILPSCSMYTQEKFMEYTCNLNEIIKLGYWPDENGFNVMLHGDMHYHNILFRKEANDELTQCKLVDFQISRQGSPIIDIMVFLVTSIELSLIHI